MLLKVHTENPEQRKIQQIIKVLEDGGVIIYPTDTVYGLGCDIFNNRAVERICRLRQLNPAKANLSFICENLSQLSQYTKPLDNRTFRLLKRNLPGPFTFIFNTNNSVPKLLKNKRKTAGIRIPNNSIAQAIIARLGRPILSISIKIEDEILEYLTDPIDIHEEYGKLVDMVVDGGISGHTASTIVDCTSSEIDILREGAGELEL
ncbi:MAG: L-threonylcarbamoyladenylate synthase [Bacteroidota bacterium]